VAPIGCGLADSDDETVYNVNADVAAGQVAAALAADRLIFLTDIAGVLDQQKQLLERLTVADVQRLIQDQTITGGMIPKVNYAVSAVQNQVKAATITDGRVPHALWKEVTGQGGSGTAITM
jgi:acetylglutamate kinase